MAGRSLKVACVQMRSTDSVAQNIEDAYALIKEAKSQGAEFIATPEMTALMEMRTKPLFEKAVAEEDDPALKAFKALAAELDIFLLIGSLAVRLSDTKCANRAYLIRPGGDVAARYDKIHMFDVEVGDGQNYRESKNYQAGTQAVLADIDGPKLGLSICYDLRFPHFYRELAKAGADILAVPAAFTDVTGRAHWHTLLRARAIETGCFVVAPAQGGHHENGRDTYGHSLIINPWGEIIAELDHQDPGILVSELNLPEVAEARSRIPALTHDRDIAFP